MVYVDLRYSFSVSKSSGKFNGGNNYAQNVLKLLCSASDEVCAICSSESVKEYLSEQYKSSLTCFVVSKLSDISFENDSIYFNPQAQDSASFVKELKHLKAFKPTVKIKLTIHDRRHHEDIFDRYNGFLNKGIKSNSLILGAGRFVNCLKKDRTVKKLLNLADDVYTVSNYSMQELLRLGNPKNISYYVQSIVFDKYTEEKQENYILFVSAGRSEKNFIRSLKAFEQYVKKTGNHDVKLKVTGLNDRQKEAVISSGIIDSTILTNQVEMLGYLDKTEFALSYAKCRFLLFTSKSEGYGLPVSEALFFEKPVVASRKSSVPEVMGSAAVYVNPYSVNSIADGIEQMMDEAFYKETLEFVKKKKDIWTKQVDLDNSVLLKRLLY